MAPKSKAKSNSTAFLQVKAVWFDGTVLDTNDISTIRGASLALLFTPRALFEFLQSKFDGKWEFTEIISGASNLIVECNRIESQDGAEGRESTDAAESLAPVLEAASEFLNEKNRLSGADAREAYSQDKYPEVDLSNFRFTVSAVAGKVSDFIQDAPASQNISPLNKTMLNGFNGALPRLAIAEALANVQQYQVPSVIIPSLGANRGNFDPNTIREQYCALNQSLPACGKDHGSVVSAATLDRRRFGRARKGDFYFEVLRYADHPMADELQKRLKHSGLGFSHSLSDLLTIEDEDGQPDVPDLPVAISGKVAIIHLDGNSFGKILGAQNFAGQMDFSREVKRLQANMLVELLNWYISDEASASNPLNDMIAPSGNVDGFDDELPRRLRLETLLWGGDEMVLAVPAWRAWEIVAVLDKALADFTVNLENQSQNLTHATGLLFCPVKMPIRLMREMADSLAGSAKCANKGSSTHFAWAVAVADSIDIPGGDILTVRQKQLGAISNDELVFLGPAAGQSDGDWASWTMNLQELATFLLPSQCAKLLDDFSHEDRLHKKDEGKKMTWEGHLEKELDRMLGYADRKQVFELLKKFENGKSPGYVRALQWLRYLDGYVLPKGFRDDDLKVIPTGTDGAQI